MKKSEVKQLLINEDNAGQRIDNFLHRYLGNIPRSRVYQMLRKGEVRVNKGRIKQTYKLVAGDRVRIPPIYESDTEKAPGVPDELKEKLSESILYEDHSIIVINKPSGLAVHAGSNQPLGVIEVMRDISPQFAKLELVHRLDRDTSGCLLLAKKLQVLRQLHQDLQQNRIAKYYTALLAGRIEQQIIKVNQPLRKNTLKSGERIVTVDPDGKSALTIFERKKQFADSSLTSVDLQTGRTHQIRVHSATIGHPIIGDHKYGDREVNQHYRKLGLKRLFLHASSLRLRSPETNEPMEISAPLDEPLSEIIDKIS